MGFIYRDLKPESKPELALAGPLLHTDTTRHFTASVGTHHVVRL